MRREDQEDYLPLQLDSESTGGDYLNEEGQEIDRKFLIRGSINTQDKRFWRRTSNISNGNSSKATIKLVEREGDENGDGRSVKHEGTNLRRRLG